MKRIFYLLIISVIIVSCSKEGSGGTSSIKGKVLMNEIASTSAEAELFHITCTEGAIIDDNDYILLNTPSGNGYYVWFDNTNWLGGDPALSGRTGIKVIYNYSESNATIAANTAAAINTMASGDYSISVNNDIITLTCTSTGSCVDAEDVNSPLIIDIENQGKGGGSGVNPNSVPAVDERVYLIYGDEDFYSESVRTDADGSFQFKGLRKGGYRIYTFSFDTITNSIIQVEVNATINKNKSVVDAGTLNIIK